MFGSTPETATEELKPLRYWFVGGGPPTTFSVEQDAPVGAYADEEVDDELIICSNVFGDLDRAEGAEFISFLDEDGERAFINASMVTVCSVPIDYVNGADELATAARGQTT